jgi:hypothetical protein
MLETQKKITVESEYFCNAKPGTCLEKEALRFFEPL